MNKKIDEDILMYLSSGENKVKSFNKKIYKDRINIIPYIESINPSIKYGYLYNWYAVNTGKLAPIGWHVATDAEWSTLTSYVSENYGTSFSVAKALASNTDWTTSNSIGAIGNNPLINNYSSFSAVPGGRRSDVKAGLSDRVGGYGYWWSSTESNATNSHFRFLYYDANNVFSNLNTKQNGYSVRCIKDNATLSTSPILDVDGNIYTEVEIGNQIWMVENLATTKYNDGSDIPNVTDNTAWVALTTDAYCAYNNDETNAFK